MLQCLFSNFFMTEVNTFANIMPAIERNSIRGYLNAIKTLLKLCAVQEDTAKCLHDIVKCTECRKEFYNVFFSSSDIGKKIKG